MTVLDESKVIFNCVYEMKPEMGQEDPIYAYVRALNEQGEIGFSVLDHITNRPDYSECGVFWVRPQDFLMVFRPCEAPAEPSCGRKVSARFS